MAGHSDNLASALRSSKPWTFLLASGRLLLRLAKGLSTSIKNFAEGSATSACKAGGEILRIVKVAIDGALAKSSEQLSLAKLGDRFSL